MDRIKIKGVLTCVYVFGNRIKARRIEKELEVSVWRALKAAAEELKSLCFSLSAPFPIRSFSY
jgi:hypothetical protein